jgi:hypothetical protein
MPTGPNYRRPKARRLRPKRVYRTTVSLLLRLVYVVLSHVDWERSVVPRWITHEARFWPDPFRKSARSKAASETEPRFR